MPNPEDATLRINASPSKEFFIHMLTRDVQLTKAIIDLVDNCVDGARRLNGDGRFDGLWVRIELSSASFSITDNCGGIPVDTARNYAFRFGRPKNAEETPNSMGLFGVGMKRTFFKLGNQFEVNSKCKTEGFTMKVNVKDWIGEEEDANNPEGWHFNFDTLETDLPQDPAREVGTAITVSDLHPTVAETLQLENFHAQLILELKTAHSLSIQQGLGITVNHVPVALQSHNLFVSTEFKPSMKELEYPREQIDRQQGSPVYVKLLAGLATRSLPEGGWYVFCNGRMVLNADKTELSIWGSSHEMRQYHPDFAYFRGYAFFDSEHSALLPWTTTKNGVDSDSALYRKVQLEMIEISKPVIAFLSGWAKQRYEAETSDDQLDTALTRAQAVEVATMDAPTTFSVAFQPRPQAGPRVQRIQYSKPYDEVEKAKTLLNVRSLKEVGERTFDYYMEYEGGN